MTPVFAVWDLDVDEPARDPLGRYGDGLCSLAVYARPDLAELAATRLTMQLKRVEVRPMVLASPPARAELPTLDIDELDLEHRYDSAGGYEVCPAGGHPLRRASDLQARSEREADG